MRYFAIALLVSATTVALWTSVTQIQPGERAVVRRFGRVLADKPGPGLHFFLPFGMDRVDRVAVGRLRKVVIGIPVVEPEEEKGTPPGQLVTGDHNLVNVQVELYWSVQENDQAIEKYVLSADRVDDLVARAAESALVEWLGGRKVETVLLDGKRRLPEWL